MSRAGASGRDTPSVVLSVDHLVKDYRVQRQPGRASRFVRAVDDVSFALARGETLGIVGESGCGKSTLARTIIGLEEATSGSVEISGAQIRGASTAELRAARRDAQMVFQDPYSSLDPRMSMFQVISQPWHVHSDLVPPKGRVARARELAQLVGLDPNDLGRRVTTFSGGQRQRIGIARALALEPKVLLLDEPVSALDVSIQAQIIELLRGLQENLGLAMVLISHDLSVVRSIAHRVAVMYLGSIVEIGDAEDIYSSPQHPYTQALLSAVPVIKGNSSTKRIPLVGEVPSPADKPSGCFFRTRCWKSEDVCAHERPQLEHRSQPQSVACFFPTISTPSEATHA